MLEALISFLLVFAIYAFIDWLRNLKKPIKPAVACHKKIARSIWIYCVFVTAVAGAMASFNDFPSDRYYRYLEENKGQYYPNDHYSELRIGGLFFRSIRYNGDVSFMNRKWEELPNEESDEPYNHILQVLHTYDSDRSSKSYGRGIILRVYDLDDEIADAQGNEEAVYQHIINSAVSDSSLVRLSDNFAPYTAIETLTYAVVSEGKHSPPRFEKYILIFANNRAYELNFYVDKKVEYPAATNAFDFLNAEFIKFAKELDLHSYNEWKESYNEWEEKESQYLDDLNIKCAIFILLYIFCIIGAIYCAVRYYRNIGNVNPKAAKITRILSFINFAVFPILGISFVAAFCSIQYEYISQTYPDCFSAYISSEYAATSVLCYGAYFLMLIIPTNKFYIRSYTQIIPKNSTTGSKHSLVYWLVRPFVLISKLFAKWTKAISEEYRNQMNNK